METPALTSGAMTPDRYYNYYSVSEFQLDVYWTERLSVLLRLFRDIRPMADNYPSQGSKLTALSRCSSRPQTVRDTLLSYLVEGYI